MDYIISPGLKSVATLTVVDGPAPAPVWAVTVKVYSVPLSSLSGVVNIVSVTELLVGACVEFVGL